MPHTSTVIVALPAEDSPVHDFGAETKHATLVFLGEIADPTFAHRAARNAADNFEPFSVPVKNQGPLGSAEPPAQVLFLDKTNLKQLHEDLLSDPDLKNQWSSIEQFPDYTPHVTIGYPGEGEDADGETQDDDLINAFEEVSEILFDRIAVWHQGERTVYPMAPQKLLGLVAGYRYVRTAEGAERFGVSIGDRIIVDEDGKAVRLDSTESEPTSSPTVSQLAVDPNRLPTKFVATVPGQKAKLPEGVMSLSNVAGRTTAASPTSTSDPRNAPVMVAPSRPRNANPELSASARSVLTNKQMIGKYVKPLSKAQRQAMWRLNKNRKLSKKDKFALRQMIRKWIQKYTAEQNMKNKKEAESSSSKPRSAAQKAATKKAQEASSKSTSSAKKKAQKKAITAAQIASAFARKMRAAYEALGGNPDALATEKDYSSSSETARPGTTKSASYSSSYMNSTAAKKQNAAADKLTTQGLTALSDEKLVSVIRSLTQMYKSNPSSQIRNAILRARKIREARALRQRMLDLNKPNGW